MFAEVIFSSDNIFLSGTLTVPKCDAPPPCVIMVHGSGAQDRDGNISGFNTQIFKYISDFLAEQGIASFRYDKRGCGKSEGNFNIAGLSEMVEDACAAIDFISEQTDAVDSKGIYLLGHSEGAVLAPEIASKKHNLAGILMLCASLRSFEEDGVKNAEIFNRDLNKMTGIKGKLARLFLYSKTPLETMIKLRRKVEKTKANRIWVSFSRVSTKFYRETFNYDVKSFLKNTEHPILAIGGSKDFQCHPDDTLLIPSISSSQSDVHIIENMDHMLRVQTEESSILSYASSCNEPIVKEVNEIICSWIIKQKDNKSLKQDK
ncbi:alpha/beta fold hydrolase [Colwellia sp. BRX8-4]|uniref:alpha/beta hydrolase family protein n=1 Tax=Colwellia sp. BRX8-4 TaxID=2759836 RepID=UPI0015F72FE7|nr:alpha/beta fold hydrolase [Colwellia sp. BRX8-4]MBA6371456.1 alpha/beta fold hydrolase [Colwellia sp. BRX8-4]